MPYEIEDGIFHIGVNDHNIDLFEGQYPIPNGMSYNSYIIKDEKIAVFDTVDQNFKNEYFNNIKEVLGDLAPDYLVIHHMEPDHSAAISEFLKIYPNVTIVGSKKALAMIGQFFEDVKDFKSVEVKNGDKLELGKHCLNFIAAPMVHWPEVMMSYESESKTLFSADAFGEFGARDSMENGWDVSEAARYYFGIVGKFGVQVQAVLKKAASLDIKRICSLHGHVLENDLEKYIKYYDLWSSYKSEDDSIVIAYTSVYGNTKKAVEYLESKLDEKGKKYKSFDLSRVDLSYPVSEIFRHSKVIFATTTYNGDIFPFMRDLITRLCERNFQNKKVSIIENGTWAPTAARVIQKLLENQKNLEFFDTVTIKSSINESNRNQLEELTDKI